MAIRIKIAKSAQELDDVFWLRYRVYEEEGYFIGSSSRFLSDHFDAHPFSSSIIAYDNEKDPIGTLRVNMDSGTGLPAEEYYDFTAHRNKIIAEWKGCTGEEPHICSAGMLAIRKNWRNRRDVIRSLFKLAGSIAQSWGVTHVIATVNYKSHSMYQRIGFKALDQKTWIEEIGEDIVPMAIPFATYYRWAVGDLLEEKALLELFSSQFHRLVLSKGEYIFKEGDKAKECYMLDSGRVKVTRKHKLFDRELTLAILKRGGLLGELALIDDKPRSANAHVLNSTELMVLSQDQLFGDVANFSYGTKELLSIFSQRIRRMDGLAMVLAYGSARQRLEYALKGFRDSVEKNHMISGDLKIKAGPSDLAQSAGVSEDEALSFLKDLRNDGACDFGDYWIRFFDRRMGPMKHNG